MTKRRTRIDATTESAIRLWAHQRRLIIVEDCPIPSMLGRLMEEGPAAGEQGARRQRWAEVFSGDGLAVQRIMAGMSELPRLVVGCYYLLIGPWWVSAGTQASAIGISTREYWNELHIGEEAIKTSLAALDSYAHTSNPMIRVATA